MFIHTRTRRRTRALALSLAQKDAERAVVAATAEGRGEDGFAY